MTNILTFHTPFSTEIREARTYHLNAFGGGSCNWLFFPFLLVPSSVTGQVANGLPTSMWKQPPLHETGGELSAKPNSTPGSVTKNSWAVAPCACSIEKCCCSEKERAAIQRAVASVYKPLFYNNNFSYICDSCYHVWWARI